MFRTHSCRIRITQIQPPLYNYRLCAVLMTQLGAYSLYTCLASRFIGRKKGREQNYSKSVQENDSDILANSRSQDGVVR